MNCPTAIRIPNKTFCRFCTERTYTRLSLKRKICTPLQIQFVAEKIVRCHTLTGISVDEKKHSKKKIISDNLIAVERN